MLMSVMRFLALCAKCKDSEKPCDMQSSGSLDMRLDSERPLQHVAAADVIGGLKSRNWEGLHSTSRTAHFDSGSMKKDAW